MAKEKELLVSIITPTFNRGKFLEENILSIKGQNYSNIEHIVVDGGSTDNSIDILKKYEKTYNLKWVSERDNGCADAMNKGFKMATGDVFCWLDSDDIYLPGTIRKIAEIFKKRPDIDVVFGDIYFANQNGKIEGCIKHTKFDIEALIYVGMVLSPQATFWRKSIGQKIGIFDTKFLRIADADFFIRMGLFGANFYHLRDFLSIYRLHSEQLTKSVELCKTEGDKLALKYQDNNLNYFALLCKKAKILTKRTFQYTKQGDALYVLRGVLRRMNMSLYKK